MTADTTADEVVAAAAASPRNEGFAGAATLIAVLTVASRLAGFGRTLVFAWAVGATVLGGIYQSANTVPNIIFEIVAGGALASLVVPLLADAVSRADRASVNASASALLTWVLTLLVPAAVVVAVAAGPIVRLLDRGAAPATVAVGADMLRVFAPQLPLYGVGIVLTGVLQAHRRFAWPVLAPLLSSVTVIGAYEVFAAVAGRKPDIAGVSHGALLVLSVGTTFGVVVLSLCLLVPARRLGLRLRPRYRFEGGAATARRLATAGAVTVAAQQLSLALTIALANGGPTGSLVLYTLAQTTYLLPWAVLALPIATSSYPALAESAARGDRAGYAATLAPATRGLLLFGSLGSAALAVLAPALARVLVGSTAGPRSVGVVATAIVWFAPGLLGYALFALLSRALYARGDTMLAAGATVAGWASVAAASLVFAHALPAGRRVAALTGANSTGMLVLGALLLAAVAWRAGPAALAGATRAGVVGVLAAGAATAAGVGVRDLVWGATTPGVVGAVQQGMLCGAVVGAVFLAVAYAGDRRDVGPALGALGRKLRRLGRLRSREEAGRRG